VSAPGSSGTPRSALVTGAGTGIGRAIALRLARDGWAVAVNDVEPDRADAVAAEVMALGVRGVAVVADVGDREAARRMVAETMATLGAVDLLVNNAGVCRLGALAEFSEADFDRQVAVNFKGVFLGCKYAVPALRARGGGVIVNTASIGARRPRRGVTVYNATKGAVLTLTRGLAGEVARDRIRVCAVCPVAADTAFMLTARGGVRRIISSWLCVRMFVSCLAFKGLTSRSDPRECSPMIIPG